MKDPYEIVKARYITEKSALLENLQHRKSNKSIARCQSPKGVFLVALDASKPEIAFALEKIYKDRNVKVAKVNTILVKSKPKRRGRMRPGGTPAFKKAIVTFEPGDTLE